MVTDIGVDAAKTGMISSVPIMEIIAAKVKEHRIHHLVIDPVMISKSGAALLKEEARHALKRLLIPLAEVVTPNLPETEVLTGITPDTEEKRKEAARRIVEMGARSVVIKEVISAAKRPSICSLTGNPLNISRPRIETGTTGPAAPSPPP